MSTTFAPTAIILLRFTKDLASQKQTNINSLTAIMYCSDVLEDYNEQHLAVVMINVS